MRYKMSGALVFALLLMLVVTAVAYAGGNSPAQLTKAGGFVLASLL